MPAEVQLAGRLRISSRSLQVYLSERVTAIDEESTAGRQRLGDLPVRLQLRLWMPTVQCPHSNCERDIKWGLPRFQLEIFNGHLTYTHATGRDLSTRGFAGLLDCLWGSVNREDMTIADASRDCTGSCTRAAPDLQDPETRPDRQGFHDLLEAC